MNRAGIRLFILMAVVVMVVQSIPLDAVSTNGMKAAANPLLGKRVQSLLDCVGLWQRPWTLFAPDPRKDLGWLSADITYSDGTTSRWTSPIWSEENSYDKFVGFRHLNYYNRFREPLIQSVPDDLADYLARNEPSNPSPIRVELSLGSIKPLLGEDTNTEETVFASREETITMLVTQPLSVREYATLSSE